MGAEYVPEADIDFSQNNAQNVEIEVNDSARIARLDERRGRQRASKKGAKDVRKTHSWSECLCWRGETNGGATLGDSRVP